MNADKPDKPDKPEMLPRPPGMTRQEHRRLYREAVKMARGDWRTANAVADEHRRRVLLSIKNFCDAVKDDQ